MGSVPFHYFDLRAFCYETEDEARVDRALRRLLPPDTELERAETEGHFGDRIVVLSARIETADGMRVILDRLADLDGLTTVIDELEERVDENCSLFVSIDKQRAFQGELAVGEGIQLRGKVEAYPAKRESAIENARGALRELG